METRSWSLKIIIIGEPSVGKTSLRRAYLGEKFRTNYIATIGADFSFKQIRINDDQINTSIWDLAGQKETFRNVHPQYYRGSAGALVVYDVTDPISFNSVTDWLEKYHSLTGESSKCPVLIVGNKIDLLAHQSGTSEEEQEELIHQLREKYDNKFPILSARTSAKTGEAINNSFEKLVKEILSWQKQKMDEPVDDSQIQLDEYVTASYLLAFHDAFGPKILTKDPAPEAPGAYGDQEFGSAIKIASILDFQDVVDNAKVTGTTPWMEPQGTLYYIGFTIDNPEARGKKSLFIIGIVAKRDLREIMSQHQNIIDGFLHNTMNEFVRLIKENKADLTSQASNLTSQQPLLEEFNDQLAVLRGQIFNTIKSDLI